MTNLLSGSPMLPAPRTLLPLAALTVLVVLAHWGLLTRASLASTPLPRTQPSPAFTMRTIALEPNPRATAYAAPPPPRLTPGPPKPKKTTPTATPPSASGVDGTPALENSAPQDTPQDPAVLQNDPAAGLPPDPNADPSADAPPDKSATNTAVKLAANTATGVTPASTPSPATADAVALNYVFPAATRLKYDITGEIKGFPYFANGELLWSPEGGNYQARLEISHFLLGARVQTSKGQLTAQGLEPVRFGDKVRSEVAAHFERSKNKVSFSANTPDAPLLPGAQDHLSVFIQLASLFGGNPNRYPPGTTITFQAIGPRSSESWVFVVGATETQTLPGGTLKTIQVTREPTGEFDPRAQAWLAPGLDYLPVRIRLTQGNGDFVEQQWRSTQKP